MIPHPSLDRAGELRLSTSPVAVAGALDPADSDPKPLRRTGGVKASLGIGDLLLGAPEAHHLRHLLLKRHAREEILDASHRWERGAPVVRSRPGRLPQDMPGWQEGTERQQARQSEVFHLVPGTEWVWSETLPTSDALSDLFAGPNVDPGRVEAYLVRVQRAEGRHRATRSIDLARILAGLGVGNERVEDLTSQRRLLA